MDDPLFPDNPSKWLIRNYKADSWISDDLWTDDWVYVVKSGSCIIGNDSSLMTHNQQKYSAKAVDELEMHRSGLKSQLRRKRREHLIDELSHRKSNRVLSESSDWEKSYR